jgi:hypothetical protein
MSFDVGHVCRFVPLYVTVLWPLAWISLFTALATLIWLYRQRRRPMAEPRPVAPIAVALQGVLVASLLGCSLLTLIYHLRFTEPSVRQYEREHPGASPHLRRAVWHDYRSDGGAALLGLSMAGVSIAARSRRSRRR